VEGNFGRDQGSPSTVMPEEEEEEEEEEEGGGGGGGEGRRRRRTQTKLNFELFPRVQRHPVPKQISVLS
jgi:hypothetical protein